MRDLGRPRLYMILAFALLAQLAPSMVSESNVLVLGVACVYGIAAIGLNIVFGMAGLLSIAQAALMAVGGYTLILLFPDPLALVPGLIAACLFAAIISTFTGLLAARVKTHYFILAAFAVAEIILLAITHLRDVTGGSTGAPLEGLPMIAGIDLMTPATFYQAAVVVLAAAWYLGDAFRASRLGVALRITAADEHLAMAAGVSVARYRVLATFVGGAFAGAAGALLAIHDGYLGPQSFELNTAILLLLVVVVAGRGRNGGVVLAAVLLTFLSHGLLELLAVGSLVYGLALIVLLVLAPQGLSGAAGAARMALASRLRAG